MLDYLKQFEWRTFIRYYQAGIVNVIFGYAVFAGLLKIGIQVYIAQILGNIIGVVFNYFTYSRHAFAGQESRIWRYILSYVVNYLLSVGALTAFLQIFPSPYLAGLIATIAVSFVNFFVLKGLVFRATS